MRKKLGAMSATVNDLERRTAELELREREAEERQKALDASRASARLGLSQALMEARARSERAEAAHRVALSEAARAEAEAAGGVFGGMSAAEAAEKAEEGALPRRKARRRGEKTPGHPAARAPGRAGRRLCHIGRAGELVHRRRGGRFRRPRRLAGRRIRQVPPRI